MTTDQTPEFKTAWTAYCESPDGDHVPTRHHAFLAGYSARDAEVARLKDALNKLLRAAKPRAGLQPGSQSHMTFDLKGRDLEEAQEAFFPPAPEPPAEALAAQPVAQKAGV